MTINIENVICNLLMRTGKQELSEKLKFRAITNPGIAICLFAQTGGYKMMKKKRTKRETNKQKKSSGNFLYAPATFVFGPSVTYGTSL